MLALEWSGEESGERRGLGCFCSKVLCLSVQGRYCSYGPGWQVRYVCVSVGCGCQWTPGTGAEEMGSYLGASAPPLPPFFSHALFSRSPRRHMVRVIGETWGPRGVLHSPVHLFQTVPCGTLRSPEVPVGWESVSFTVCSILHMLNS